MKNAADSGIRQSLTSLFTLQTSHYSIHSSHYKLSERADDGKYGFIPKNRIHRGSR